MLPYSAPSISEDDIAAVSRVLRSGWLTTGPEIELFEKAFCEYTGARHAVAVSSGTAALEAAIHALGIGPGDEVIVPTLTFVATANAVVYQGGTPVFADVEPDTLLIDPKSVERLITKKTKAIVGVDYAGQPADYANLADLAYRGQAHLVGDCCHSLGSSEGPEGYRVKTGSQLTVNCFSLHAIKAITSGEGGVVTTCDSSRADAMRQFRNHGRWNGFMVSLGYNYRMTDFQAALARSQLARLDLFVAKRREIAAVYDEAFKDGPVTPLVTRQNIEHARHLYVVRVKEDNWLTSLGYQFPRDALKHALRGAGIESQVHYRPVHLEEYYRYNYGTKDGDCPVAEEAADEILSLPIFPDMKDEDVGRVIEVVKREGAKQ